MSTTASALDTLVGGASGSASLITAVGSLLPTSTSGTSHATASSDTEAEQTELKLTKATGTTDTTEKSSGTESTKGVENTAANILAETKGLTTESVKGTEAENVTASNRAATNTSGNELFSGQGNITNTQTMVTDPAIMRIMNLMLQGDGGIQGLQSVMAGERNAGLYNSSTNQLLSNNLMTTVSGEAARLAAPTIQSQSLGQTSTSNATSAQNIADALTKSNKATSAESILNNLTSALESSTGQTSKASTTEASQQAESSTVTAQDIMDMVQSLASQYTNQASDSKTKTKTKKGLPGCYITTAVVEGLALSDDCEELSTLREFRDTWLQEFKPEEVAKYYEEAPRIVEVMHELHELEFFDLVHELYYAYIIPAVTAIKICDPERAYEIYKAMVTRAKEVLKLSEA